MGVYDCLIKYTLANETNDYEDKWRHFLRILVYNKSYFYRCVMKQNRMADSTNRSNGEREKEKENRCECKKNQLKQDFLCQIRS